MILKKKTEKKRLYFSFNRFLYIYFLSTIFIGIVLVIVVLQSQKYAFYKFKFLDWASKAGRIEYIYLPKIAFQAIKSNFYKLEKVDLQIKFNDSLILENTRNEAKKLEGWGLRKIYNLKGIPEVNFKLEDKNEIFTGKIRLKGDRRIHWEDKERSSYKIKLDKNQYFLGLRKFSLQKPRTRNYIHEWIFHQMMKDFDIIALKYNFLNLSINGEDKGLYVLEEGFGKELIERNKRRNGPIFGLDEDLSTNEKNPVFEIYNKKYWGLEENSDLARTASQKLRDFFNKEIAADQVFDFKKWAAYFAVVDMTSTYHGAWLKSVKFYYNPLNGLFEPIPYDGHRLKPNYHSYNLKYNNDILIDKIDSTEKNGVSYLKAFFYKNDLSLNESFYNLYIENLNTISSKKYIDKFLLKNLKKINKINSHIYSDHFFNDNRLYYGHGLGLYYFSLSDFFHQVENIKKKLKSKKKVQVLKINDSEFLIKNHYIGYKNYGSVIADKIICSRDNQNVKIKISKPLNNFSDTVIKLPKEQVRNLRCTHVNFTDKFNNDSFLLKIDTINSKFYYKSHQDIKLNTLNKYFVKKDKNLFLLEDEVKIDQNIYIPKGFKVVIKPGQKILLINNAFIISNSPWTIGGKGKRTIITGEKNNLGGGILIGDSSALSKINNTKFSYLSGYNIKLNSELLIFGSINFHQTNVEINNVDFENIFSEDAINIFRSSFEINNSNYKDISSDAIDVDFSDGTIKMVSFKNIINDAMDFSGSNVNIYDSYFENVNDKLISGGEASNIKVSKISAINSKFGIISKDGTKIYSKNILFENVEIPFAAYQKKKNMVMDCSMLKILN